MFYFYIAISDIFGLEVWQEIAVGICITVFVYLVSPFWTVIVVALDTIIFGLVMERYFKYSDFFIYRWIRLIAQKE